MSDWERFAGKVMPEPNSGCWLWVGALFSNGYGAFWRGKQNVRAHRYSYSLHLGEVPDGLVLDHKCRVRSCVNPHHLEPVTVGENIRRGNQGLLERRRTHCPRGHPYNEANTYRSAKGKRHCRACGREFARRKKARAQTHSAAARPDHAEASTPHQSAKTPRPATSGD